MWGSKRQSATWHPTALCQHVYRGDPQINRQCRWCFWKGELILPSILDVILRQTTVWISKCFAVMVDRHLLRRRLYIIAAWINSNILVLPWMHWRGWKIKMLLLLKVCIVDINAMPHAIVYFLMNLAFEGFVFFLVQMKIQWTAKDPKAIFHSTKRSWKEMVSISFPWAHLFQILLIYCFFLADDIALYESLKDYILTEDKLIESNYPVQHPEKPSCAVLFVDNKKGITDGKWKHWTQTPWCSSNIIH